MPPWHHLVSRFGFDMARRSACTLLAQEEQGMMVADLLSPGSHPKRHGDSRGLRWFDQPATSRSGNCLFSGAGTPDCGGLDLG